MRPTLSNTRTPNRSGCYTKHICEGLPRKPILATELSNSFDVYRCQFGMGAFLASIGVHAANHTISVRNVFCWSDILKVPHLVVLLVSILVIDLQTIRAWTNKHVHNKSVNEPTVRGGILPKNYRPVPIPGGIRGEDFPLSLSFAKAVLVLEGLNPIKATNTSLVADLVQSFVSRYVLPTLEHGKNPFNRKTLRGVQGFLPEAGRHAGPFTLYSFGSLPARSDMNIVPLAERMFKHAAS